MCLYIIFACLAFTLGKGADTASATEEANLYNVLMTDYNKNVRPRNTNDQPTDVHLYMTLRSVTKLDELSGILTSGWIMQVNWMDNNLTWDPISYGNITDIGIDKSSIWSPGLSLLNPATYAES